MTSRTCKAHRRRTAESKLDFGLSRQEGAPDEQDTRYRWCHRPGPVCDVLLAADAVRPGLLEDSGAGIAESRRTFAIGALKLWSRDTTAASTNCRTELDSLGNRRLAIANPVTAPYGAAARQFLAAAGLWEAVLPQLVYGESAAQALHFVATGNASFGLIAASQARDPRLPASTCSWPVPERLHEPLEHQAIIISSTQQREAAQEFIDFVTGPKAKEIILRAGYRVAE